MPAHRVEHELPQVRLGPLGADIGQARAARGVDQLGRLRGVAGRAAELVEPLAARAEPARQRRPRPTDRAPGRSASGNRSSRTSRRAARARRGSDRRPRPARAFPPGAPIRVRRAARLADCEPSAPSTRDSCARRAASAARACASGRRRRSGGSGRSHSARPLRGPARGASWPATGRFGVGSVGQVARVDHLGAKESLLQRRWILALPAGACRRRGSGTRPIQAEASPRGSGGRTGDTRRPRTQICTAPSARAANAVLARVRDPQQPLPHHAEIAVGEAIVGHAVGPIEGHAGIDPHADRLAAPQGSLQ